MFNNRSLTFLRDYNVLIMQEHVEDIVVSFEIGREIIDSSISFIMVV